jgi:hypothetical protein
MNDELLDDEFCASEERIAVECQRVKDLEKGIFNKSFVASNATTTANSNNGSGGNVLNAPVIPTPPATRPSFTTRPSTTHFDNGNVFQQFARNSDAKSTRSQGSRQQQDTSAKNTSGWRIASEGEWSAASQYSGPRKGGRGHQRGNTNNCENGAARSENGNQHNITSNESGWKTAVEFEWEGTGSGRPAKQRRGALRHDRGSGTARDRNDSQQEERHFRFREGLDLIIKQDSSRKSGGAGNGGGSGKGNYAPYIPDNNGSGRGNFAGYTPRGAAIGADRGFARGPIKLANVRPSPGQEDCGGSRYYNPNANGRGPGDIERSIPRGGAVGGAMGFKKGIKLINIRGKNGRGGGIGGREQRGRGRSY